ncbi:MAG: polysaccharide deacetylase family protein [Planctomycetes bacterium]|nr:polysaccharide deacetylase family protein [Planctomycetota bacterium]
MRAILTYHSIDSSGSPISLDEGTLRRHIAFLRSGKVAVVRLEELLLVPERRDAVALTFDDGFANFESVAWPLLRYQDFPVTLFVATGRVGLDNAWGGTRARGIPTLPLLGWDALRRMRKQGLTLGSHSRTHPRLTEVDDATLADELDGSIADMERELGYRPTSFCYPYGALDARVADAVRTRFERACTTELGLLPATPDAHGLPRLDAYYYRSSGRLESFGSGGFRRHLWLRATLRRLRRR